ncbi:hypothetical protein ACFVTX_18135 [Agromyces sp. NPDC058136]|uniref:hypothetical protein n=1 Tax=Agromyces sp. NPDC058136 TaxID=3346354 RepID=UPI0036D9D90E
MDVRWSSSPWYADPVWGFVADIATVLSLVALVIAVAELGARAQAVAPVAWGVDLIGTVSIGRDQFHVVEIHNGGTGAANLISAAFVDARVVLDAEHRMPAVMGSGDTRQLFVSAVRIDEAWIRLVWIPHHANHFVNVQWLPLTRHGIAGYEWERSRARTPRIYWWSRPFVGWKPHYVGPGGRAMAPLRRLRTEQLSVMVSDGKLSSEAAMGGNYVKDLPYVKP